MESKKLSWRNITLKQYEKSYFDFVYSCYQNYESRFLFTNDFIIISKDEFWNYLHKNIDCNFHDFMIIIDNVYNLPIGFIYTYNYDLKNRKIIHQEYIPFNIVDKIMAVASQSDIMVHLFNNGSSIVSKKNLSEMARYHMGIYQPIFLDFHYHFVCFLCI